MRTRFSIALLLILLNALWPASSVQGQIPTPPSVRDDLTNWRRQAASASLVPSAVEGLGVPGVSYSYASTIGQTGLPYQVDTQHLNRPVGLFVDSLDFVYVVEEAGYRALKYDANGQSQLVLGAPGQADYGASLLAYPQDTVVDAGGAIWTVFQHGVKQVSRLGELLQTFPSTPWASGTNNARFRFPRGIALDRAGKLYVSDSGNHRIQVYTITSGAPVYHSTIGETGVSGSDASHFNFPGHLAVDSGNRLYVADTLNQRVQRCALAGSSWTCTTFHGTGVSGDGTDQLNEPWGVALDSAGNVWIADSRNARVKKCTSQGSCAVFAAGMSNTSDVAVASDGTVYVSDWYANVVRRYAADGSAQGVFAGTAGVPYLPDPARLNTPSGLGVASDGNLYVIENLGYRLLKLDAAGQPLWTVGQAGTPGNDNAHFGDFWEGPQGSLAVDASGHVYVPDMSNDRVQVFNADGSFSRSFGSPGSGNAQLDCPVGVAISPANGDILVADTCNQRVQVYDAAWNYKLTLGTTGIAGSSERHFNSPAGVTADKTGAVYVADTNNYRVQKCTLADGDYTCMTFVGERGVFSSSFDHLHPVSVAVNTAGTVAVVDQRNQRVQIFDRQGNYLTTIGGPTAYGNSSFLLPMVVQFDDAGALWVVDQNNHRIQRFTSSNPGWRQLNLNGFGDLSNSLILSLGTFNGQVYAGTDNATSGAQLWRTSNASAGGWAAVTTNGFGDTANGGINHLLAFSGQLYAGTWNWNSAANASNGGQLWRSADGTSWQRVVEAGFGDATNGEIFRLIVFNHQLYASTWSYTDTHGAELWRSADGTSWSRVVTNGFGEANNAAILSLAVFDGYLYAGTLNDVTGGQLWRSADGVVWLPVNAAGFGYASNWAISALASFDGFLYASVRDRGQVWRCQACDASDWELVASGGLGNPATIRASALEATDDALYLVIGNYTTGLEVWRSSDGLEWQPACLPGLGDNNNRAPFWDNSVLAVNGQLLVGTWNTANGGEIWSYQSHALYFPAVWR